ncbi:MAG: M23 family metallopeptidase [Thermodesulfobacteriota bacterium]
MKKSRNKRSRLIIALLPIAIILIIFVWFLMTIFEGQKPLAGLTPLSDYLSESTTFTLRISDAKMGLRDVKAIIKQDGTDIPIIKKNFPYKGLFNKQGVHAFNETFTINPKQLNLVQGDVNLIIEIHDFSKRRGGDGNLTILEHKMTVDTIPPSITAISRSHNVNMGGSGLIIYRVSTDTQESGVLINDILFPGVPATNDSQNGVYLCYFAFPCNEKKDTRLNLWGKDMADNEIKKSFHYHIRQKRFPKDTMRISNRLLDTIISSFSPDLFKPGDSNIEKFLFINKTLREKNAAFLRELCQSPSKEKLWDGPWLRMEKAATMATFGDQRTYYYKDKVVDRQLHLGVDLASLARSPVQAANTGKVVFAQDLDIYGLTIIIDHGQGLFTLYGHLSSMNVAVNQDISKGDIIGVTGTTGLAMGDHLHFGFLVHGVPVNPIEWWDSHWIKDNIYKKLSILKEPGEQ